MESLCQRKPEQLSFINQHVLPARTEAQYGLTWGLASGSFFFFCTSSYIVIYLHFVRLYVIQLIYVLLSL